jgi:hypothetical protein
MATETRTDFILTIPGTPAYGLSLNSREHWTKQRKASRDAKWAVKAALAEAEHEGRAWKEPIHGPVTITWGIHLARRRKFMDKDNATATLKPFMDALVENGIIDGDTPDIVTDIKIVQFLYKVDHTVEEGEIDVIVTPIQERGAAMRGTG